MKVKVCQVEEQLGVVLPDELIASLGWEPGDVLQVELENGGLKIVRVQTAFEHGMQVAEGLMDEYRETLKVLAKT
jgi:putative addiction module antidote